MKQKHYIIIAVSCLLLISCLFVNEFLLVGVSSSSAASTKIVLIDPGHGGHDPGKVGINDSLEKDINLEIALKLKLFLEQNDVTVIMTRETDKGLYSETDRNKKNADLRNRKDLIVNSRPDAVISIHQNSFSSEQEHGAQTFYYSSSKESALLADYIQNQIITSVDPDNKRKTKANDSYYLLKINTAPTVIVECGFLSNYEEANHMIEPVYQEKMAYAIHLGVLQFLNDLS